MLARSLIVLLLCSALCSQGAVQGTPPREQARPGEAQKSKPVKKEPVKKQRAVRPRSAAERLRRRLSKQWTKKELAGLRALLDVSVFHEPSRIAPGSSGTLFLKIPTLGMWGRERSAGRRPPIRPGRRGYSSQDGEGLVTRFLIQPRGRIEVDASSGKQIRLGTTHWERPRNGEYYQDTFLVRVPLEIGPGTEHGQHAVKGRIRLFSRLELLPLSPAEIRLRKAIGAPTDRTRTRSLIQGLGLRELALGFSGRVHVGPALPTAVPGPRPKDAAEAPRSAGEGATGEKDTGEPPAGRRAGSGQEGIATAPGVPPGTPVEASAPRAESDLEADDQEYESFDLPLVLGGVLCLGLLLLVVLRARRG